MASADPGVFANATVERSTPGVGVLLVSIGRPTNPIPLPTGSVGMMEEVDHSGIALHGVVHCTCPQGPVRVWIVVGVQSAGEGD